MDIEYENAFVEAVKFNFPELYLDPMMRAAALGQMGKTSEAGKALRELLELEPVFVYRGRQRVNRYVKVNSLIDKIFEGLQKAGLDDHV